MDENCMPNIKRKKKKITGIKNHMKQMSQEEAKNALLKKKQCNEEAVKIVQCLIEREITEDFLISSLIKINQSHFEDIVEERALTKMCGYPLCDSPLVSVPSKQYQISTRANKVYDITERKCFCSNMCYKAGKYLKDQLLTSPLWLRECEDKIDFKLLSLCSNSGSSGLEVDLGRSVVSPKDVLILEETIRNISVVDTCQKNCSGNNGFVDSVEQFKLIVKEEKEQFKKTEDIIFQNDVTSEKKYPDKPQNNIKLTDSQISNQIDFHVSKPESSKRRSERSDRKEKQDKPVSIETFIIKLEKIMKSWISIETICFLLGEEKVKEELENLGVELNQKKVDPYLYERYSNLCKKLNFLELEETYGSREIPVPEKPLPNFEKLKEEAKELEIKVRSFYRGDVQVSFKPEPESKIEAETILPDLPPVDHHAANSVRKKIFLHKLYKTLPDIQTALGLNLFDLTELVKGFVSSLQLTAHNITLKPSEWNIAAIVIIKLLSLHDENLAEAMKCDKAFKYLELILMSYSVHSGYLDRLISWLLDINSLL